MPTISSIGIYFQINLTDIEQIKFMENITYFTGAGASYHSLPLIKTMNARMKAFKIFLEIQLKEGRLKNNFAEQFINELEQLLEIETQRTSIDAYARELSISGSSESEVKLMRLKAILSSYIIFEQLIKPTDLSLYSDEYDYSIMPPVRLQLDDDLKSMIKTNIDKRYITFWGEYLTETNTTLPNNIKVLSWNYDMQFESSYSHIKNYKLENTQKNLQVFPSLTSKIDLSKSCILKLNGTAGLLDDYNTKKKFNLFDLKEHKLMDNLEYLITLLEKNYNRSFYKPLFTFAWENDEIVDLTRQYAKKIMDETNILVIIGYSFPTFNRLIDRQIFSNISNLKKVYFQAPRLEMDDLLDKLDGINPILRSLTKPVYNLDTFYIPNEH
jgi:hypothetical protein